MGVSRFVSRRTTLREASAVIFALCSILPLLIFVFFVWRFDLIDETEIQVGLFLALVIAVLGFVVFRRLLGRFAEIARALAGPAPSQAVATPLTRDRAAVPAVGQVGEIGEIAGAFTRMLEDLRGSTARLEDFVFKLGTLNEMVDMAARIPSVQELLTVVLERSMRIVRARIGSVMLLDPARESLRLVAAHGLPEEVCLGSEVKIGEGIAGKVVQLGVPVLVEDIEKDPRFGTVNDPKYGNGSFIGMPVRIGDRIIGVLSLAKKEPLGGGPTDPATFSFTDLQFLSTLMGYAGYAVDNARLLEEAQASARRLQAVVEVQQTHVQELDEKSRQLEEAKNEAESANRFKSQFLTVMSHELRTPLNSIIGFSKVLINRLSGELTEPQEAQLRVIHASSVHLLGLINSVLDMARIEAGKIELLSGDFDVQALVDECVEVSRSLAHGKHLALEADVAPNRPSLHADRVKVKQILLNLLSNAIKFTVAGRVLVSVKEAPDGVHFSVADTGIGIPGSDLPRLFEPFRRRDNPVVREAGGTGLGLAISRSFVELHGGRIWVESREYEGSTFHFVLPFKSSRT